MTKSGGISRVERAGFWFTGVRGGLFSASGSVPPDKRALQNPHRFRHLVQNSRLLKGALLIPLQK
jgi:hypothetical protein